MKHILKSVGELVTKKHVQNNKSLKSKDLPLPLPTKMSIMKKILRMLSSSTQGQRQFQIHLDHARYVAILQLMSFILESMVRELI